MKKFKINFEMGTATPDVWIEPKNSIILEVKCSELIKTDKYTSGFTLRFPRIIGIRDDKLWHHCNTLKDLMKFSTVNRNYLNNSNICNILFIIGLRKGC